MPIFSLIYSSSELELIEHVVIGLVIMVIIVKDFYNISHILSSLKRNSLE